MTPDENQPDIPKDVTAPDFFDGVFPPDSDDSEPAVSADTAALLLLEAAAHHLQHQRRDLAATHTWHAWRLLDGRHASRKTPLRPAIPNNTDTPGSE